MSDPVLCLHPDAATEYKRTRGRWAKQRCGRRWRLHWRPPQGVYVKRCPVCPAVAYQLDTGMAVHLVLGPWLMLAGGELAS